MATRKDLLKAHAFTSRRMIAAFVDRDPDDPTPPLRRVGTATFVSVLLGVVLLAGTALIGLLRGGISGDSWRDENNVVLNDTKSGQLFALVDDSVIPVTDITTARLLAGGADPAGPPRMINVQTSALKGVALAEGLTIPGAPPQLPAAADLAAFPLRLCSTAPGGRDRYMTLQFGATEPSSMDYSFIATTDQNTQYLISGGRAFELYAPRGSSTILKGDLPEVRPGNSWIGALPMGPPILPPEVRGYGEQARNAYMGLSVGSIVKVEGSETSPSRYYIQRTGGLSAISYLEAMLLRTERKADNTPIPSITEAQLVQYMDPDDDSFSEPDIPMYEQKAPPGATTGDNASVCATFTAENPDRVSVSMGQTTPELSQAEMSQAQPQFIAHYSLAPLEGALLRNAAVTSSEEAVVTLLLNGRGYQIPTVGARNALGYGEAEALPVTSGLLNLIRSGLPAGGALSCEYIRAEGEPTTAVAGGSQPSCS